MAAPLSWANLPLDAMSEVARRILCTKDRFEVARACRTWRAALAQTPPPPPPPPPLPWLLLPSGDSAHLYCMLRGCRIDHRFNDDPIGSRRFGSHDGARLFAARHHPLLHRLVDYRCEEIHPLPSVVCPRHHPGVQHVHRMLILAATLSDVPNVRRSVAAGIVTYQRYADGPRERRFAFWRMGAEVAFDNMPPDDDPNSAVEDVLYRHRDGAFHFLTGGEDILVCVPGFVEGGDQLGGVAATLHRFVPRDRSCDLYVRARYLVESRRDLLMVVRFTPHPQMPTSAFKVFRAIGPQMPDDNGGGVLGYPWAWIELDTLALAGRMLFVGRGCSRSYEVADYPGLEDGVYFTDDRCFYRDEMMLRGLNERQYLCSDNGRWSKGPPPNVEHFFPDQGPSNHSSPTWILP